jgi:lipoprotein NlpD
MPAEGPIRWQWPVEGRVLAEFSPERGSKGIDIDGREGAEVRAAAPGRVVYAGDGLRGYGNLVIVKHNDTLLSAYAHARRLLVEEGARVEAGQAIAELGATGADRPKLHFEIRRNGQPVDPLRLLPVRGS